MRFFHNRLFFLVLLVGIFVFSPASAKNKKSRPVPKVPQDVIEVVGHIPLTGGRITRFLATQHYSSSYLYVERDDGNRVTLIDVTKASQPSVLADMTYPPNAGATGILAVAGTAALVTNERRETAPVNTPQTIRIIDFSDSQQPKVIREFTGVTAISHDDPRGLIFIANGEGIWILHKSLAEDPEVEKAYAHQIMYGGGSLFD